MAFARAEAKLQLLWLREKICVFVWPSMANQPCNSRVKIPISPGLRATRE
jgi:hypothetical protein